MNPQDKNRYEQLRAIGSNISRLREDKGLTQTDFAYMLGYSNHAHLSRIESGKKAPSVPTLLRMAEILDVQTREFFKDV